MQIPQLSVLVTGGGSGLGRATAELTRGARSTRHDRGSAKSDGASCR